MEYNFHSQNILDYIYSINNINESDLDTSRFISLEKDNKHILSFKEKILFLKDCRFLIVGDYDCDGICATTIIKRLFDCLNIESSYYIPSRIDEGYGISEKIITIADKHHYDAIITVDNGAVAKDALAYANKLGIKVLVLDHHEYTQVPDCFGFLHPELLDEDFKRLSAGGLSYLLSSYFYDDELSLVLGGLSILGDMVGVLNYNRYLLKEMMNILNTKNIYQLALLNGSNKFDYDSLSFNCIPKINAVSRMGYNANLLVKYMLSNYDECKNMLNSINSINDFRKSETNRETDLALSMFNKDDKVALIVSSEFKEGICGLIANKICLSYETPCIIFSKKDGILKGSGRSPKNVNIFDYLSNTKELFDTFGGHGQACGLSINEDKLDKLIEYVNNNDLDYQDSKKDVLDIDIDDINIELIEQLDSLKPYGVDLKEPLIRVKDFKYKSKFLIKNKYPKFSVNNNLSAICFNESYAYKQFDDLIGYVRRDSYHRGSISLLIEDLL